MLNTSIKVLYITTGRVDLPAKTQKKAEIQNYPKKCCAGARVEFSAFTAVRV
ncbi:hypothetical protein FHU29_002779 [Hoyosella altamirensis]|uniref:Uncharacterized protein n=1 Tax=Hoyosella altamirensis TaxID=616997 RepID=A0A839RP87_9ACTN|nr:hypothetical protein [Hoyosella altamirensis]